MSRNKGWATCKKAWQCPEKEGAHLLKGREERNMAMLRNEGGDRLQQKALCKLR